MRCVVKYIAVSQALFLEFKDTYYTLRHYEVFILVSKVTGTVQPNLNIVY